MYFSFIQDHEVAGAGLPPGPGAHMKKSFSLSVFLVLLQLPMYLAAEIPPPPGPGEFLQDYARVIHHHAAHSIRELQKVAFEQHDTPIVVVTIHALAKYDAQGSSLDRLAFSWFNKWQIGKRGSEGELINKGILLLVSIGDRKSRIELGAEWGQTHNGHCDKITRSVMIPRFKRGDYSGGLRAAVAELARLASMSARGEGLPAMNTSGSAAVRTTRGGDLIDRTVDRGLSLSLDKEFVKNNQLRPIAEVLIVILAPLLFLLAAILDAFYKGRSSPICKLTGGGLFALGMVLGGAPFFGVIFPLGLTSHALLGKKWYLWWGGVVGVIICLSLQEDPDGGLTMFLVVGFCLLMIPFSFVYTLKLLGFGWYWMNARKAPLYKLIPKYREKHGSGGFLSGGGGGGGFSSGGFSGGGGSSGSW